MKQITAIILLLVAVASLDVTHQASNMLKFSLDYAPRQGASFKTCGMAIYWNRILVSQIFPQDYEIHTLNLDLKAQVGENTIDITGSGASDSWGMTINNVKLSRGTQQFLVNGNFKEGHNLGDGADILRSLKGWTCNEKGMEVGNAYNTYNKRWPKNYYAVQLDANQNTDISQSVTFDSNFNVVKK